jgi:hypothetical protein
MVSEATALYGCGARRWSFEQAGVCYPLLPPRAWKDLNRLHIHDLCWVFEVNGVGLTFSLCLCNPTTKLLQVSAYGGEPPFCAWLVANLCGRRDVQDDHHQENGEHHQNMLLEGTTEASSQKI